MNYSKLDIITSISSWTITFLSCIYRTLIFVSYKIENDKLVKEV